MSRKKAPTEKRIELLTNELKQLQINKEEESSFGHRTND